MDVGDWLRTLGLQQYETLFRENDVDAELLSTLGADTQKRRVLGGKTFRLPPVLPFVEDAVFLIEAAPAHSPKQFSRLLILLCAIDKLPALAVEIEFVKLVGGYGLPFDFGRLVTRHSFPL